MCAATVSCRPTRTLAGVAVSVSPGSAGAGEIAGEVASAAPATAGRPAASPPASKRIAKAAMRFFTDACTGPPDARSVLRAGQFGRLQHPPAPGEVGLVVARRGERGERDAIAGAGGVDEPAVPQVQAGVVDGADSGARALGTE